jgi:hypothetical protein
MPWYLVPKELMAYVISTGSESGMDDLLLKWVLFEWLRDCKKEQAHAEIVSLKEISNCIANLFNFQRLIPFLSLRSLAIIAIIKNMFRNKKCIGSNLQDV